MRSLKWAALCVLIPTFVCAQPFGFVLPNFAAPSFPPPGPGTPVDFVACPERTAGGSWMATDASTGFTYSLAGARVIQPNVFVRVTGVVSPVLIDTPGWALTPIKVLAGTQPCRSPGVLQPGPASGPLFPYVVLPRL